MKYIVLVLFFWVTNAVAIPCLPREAGGIGTDFVSVDYVDHKAVIYTYQCNGQPYAIIAKYEWKPLRPAPTNPKKLSEELRRLDTLHGYAQAMPELEQLAKDQQVHYAPVEGFKQRTKVRNI